MTLKTLLGKTLTSCSKIAPSLALIAASVFANPVHGQDEGLFDVPARPRTTVRFKEANVIRPATNFDTTLERAKQAAFQDGKNSSNLIQGVAFQTNNELQPAGQTASPQKITVNGQHQPTPAVRMEKKVTVRAFYVKPNDLDPITTYLRTNYAEPNKVTVAADKVKRQVLVMAADQDHEIINQFMAKQGYTSTDPFSPNPLDLGNIPNAQYQLTNLNWSDVESMVTKIWKGKASVLPATDGRSSVVNWPLADNKSVAVRVDRVNNRLSYQGGEEDLAEWHKAVKLLDVDKKTVLSQTQFVKVGADKTAAVKQAVSMYSVLSKQTDPKPKKPGAFGKPKWGGDVATSVFQPVQQAQGQEGTPEEPISGLSPNARIEVLDDGTVIIVGDDNDRKKLRSLLENLVKTADMRAPETAIQKLEHRDSAEIIPLVQRIYDAQFQAQYGPVDLSSIGENNSVFIVGSSKTVKAVTDLLVKLDQPVADDSESFKVFRLKFVSAVDASQRLTDLFDVLTQGNTQAEVGASPILRVVPDYRSNTLIISASPQQMKQIEKMIEAVDVDESMAKDVIKVFPLRNSLATELAPILQDALNGQLPNAGRSQSLQNNQGGAQGQNVGGQANSTTSTLRSHSVSLKMLDAEGKEISAIMFDVRVNADVNSNQLIVTGPEKSMELIGELIRELDRLPNAESQVKVFTIVNGDATTLAATLNALFASGQQAQGGGVGQNGTVGQLPLVTGDGATSLVGLQISTDVRTNSIIVAGSEADLNVVEALLARLDQNQISNRVYKVFRLQHVLAQTVADELNSWLQARNVFNSDTSNGAGEAIFTQVIVQAEVESNSLIIAATPEYYNLVAGIIKDIDHRRQVLVQALIAEVTLGDTEEFGFEWGIQDSLLFDRGLNASSLADGSPIGFPFNQVGIGNSLDATGLSGRENLAGQALSNLSIGRTNDSLGYGGLVLSAGNESISMLLRALKDRSQARVLSRPQIRTLENLQGFTQVGQDIPILTTSQNQVGGVQTFGVEYQPVGIQLSVTPRVGVDGTIYMEVDVTNSSLNPGPGIAIQTTPDGGVIEQPIINNTSTQTTISARNGQTVVIGGLINTSVSDTTRGIPFISDIPLLGRLFRFDSTTESRSELLILLRPIIIDDEETDLMANQLEFDRMNWCLQDVHALHGPLDSPSVPDLYTPMNGNGQAPAQLHAPSQDAPMQFSAPVDLTPQAPSGAQQMPEVDPSLGSKTGDHSHSIVGLPKGGLGYREIPGATAQRRVFGNPFKKFAKKKKEVEQASFNKE